MSLWTLLQRSLKLNLSTIGRLLSGGLALFLALVYSSLLGVEKRSILSFAFVTSILIMLVFTASFSTRYRKIATGTSITDSIHFAFLIWCCFLALTVGVFVVLTLFLYSRLIANLAPNLVLVILIYSVSMSLSCCLQEFLPTIGYFKAAIISDISLITFQLITFLFIVSIDQLSIIVGVLLALTISYAIHISSIASLIVFHGTPKGLFSELRRLTHVKGLFLVSCAIHVVDRIDKVAIAFLLPISTLAQFTTMAAFFSPVRVITESSSRQLYFFNNPGKDKEKVSSGFNYVSGLKFVGFFLAIPIIVATLTNSIIESLLGKEWLLSKYVVALYFVYEVIRGLYLYMTNYRISNDRYGYSFKASFCLLLLAIFLVPISVFHFGLVGALVAMITTYGLVMTGLKLVHAF